MYQLTASVQSVPSAFALEVVPERESVRVRPRGELDMATSPRLRRCCEDLLSVGFRRLLLDLCELGFMDSAGLHTIVHLDQFARARGAKLALLPGPRPVARVFELSGVRDRLEFCA